MLRSVEVFVTGGEPSVTYVSRDGRNLEQRVERYLSIGGKVLTIAGPSKAGKSVLVHQVLRKTETKALTLTGASISTIHDFWTRLAHQAGLDEVRESLTEQSKQSGRQAGLKAGGGSVPVEIAGQQSSAATDKQGSRQVAVTSIGEAVKAHLCTSGDCLVIDDFHYAEREARKAIAREIKDMIFRGVRIVLIAAPSRVFDLVQSEGELVGRVERIRVESWTELELVRIPTLGFTALNLEDPAGEIASKLVGQSFGSPLLMQQLCLSLCDHNNVDFATEGSARRLSAPYWNGFFAEVSENLRPAVIEALKAGPMSRRRRRLRECVNGEFYDLYSIVLVAINRLLPAREIAMSDLSDAVTEFMFQRPAMADLRKTCKQMEKIAREHAGEGDAAIDFREQNHPEILSIEDPYLQFYIGWGIHEMGLPTFRG